MESPSPVVQKIKTKKCLTEEKRAQAFKTTTENIKQELIRKGYGTRENLTSQPAVLMRVAEILNGDDLKAQYPVQPRRKCKSGKMTKEEEKVVKAEREQMRRNKKNHAIHSLREFINRKGLRNGSSLEQLDVVEIVLEHIKTLPVLNALVGQTVAPVSPISSSRSPTLPPGRPTLSPSPPLLQQMFNFPTPFPMMPVTMNPAAIQFQLQYQKILQNMKNLQNQGTEQKDEQSSLAENPQPSEVPMESDEEDVDLLN